MSLRDYDKRKRKEEEEKKENISENKKIMRIITTAILFISMFSIAYSQQLNYPLQNDFNRKIENTLINISKESRDNEVKLAIKYNYFVNTSFKPILKSSVRNYDITNNTTSRDILDQRNTAFGYQLHKKLFYDDLLVLDTGIFHIAINPLFRFEYGKGKSKVVQDMVYDNSFFQNTRGIEIKGNITDKFSFYTNFYENQTSFPDYITERINKTKAIPSNGRFKPYGDGGFDYSSAEAYLSYSPNKNFNFQFGHGKHFIGDGYRSLLLSDNSFSYPYLRITYNYKRLQYTNLFTEFQNTDINDNLTNVVTKKHGTFNFLNYFATKWLQIGLFEGIIWKTSKDSSAYKSFDANYFNPIILFRPIQYGLNNNKNNILLGLNAKANIKRRIQLYSQLAFNDLKKDNIATQIGAKVFLNRIIGGLGAFILLENNYSAQNTYLSKEHSASYTNFNQAITSPLGSNYNENIGILHFDIRQLFGTPYNFITLFLSNVFVEGKINYAKITDIQTNNKLNLLNYTATMGFLLNPKTNLKIYAGYNYRKLENTAGQDYFYFGIATDLKNMYLDF